MMMMSFAALAIVTVLWVLYGYSIAFGESDSQLLGSLDHFGLHGPAADPSALLELRRLPADVRDHHAGADHRRHRRPRQVRRLVRVRRALGEPGLLPGRALGVRLRRRTPPLGDDAGWLVEWGVQDFAGGTAVHINAGAAGLALALVLGKRLGWKRDPMRPHNLPLVLLGAGAAVVRLVRLQRRLGAGRQRPARPRPSSTRWSPPPPRCIGWLVVEQIRDGHPTSLGAASGAVAGLVAITPACAFVVAARRAAARRARRRVCALAVGLKCRFGFDDSLDVVGVHLVGGCVRLDRARLPRPLDGGLFYDGRDVDAAGQADRGGARRRCSFSFVGAYVIGKVIDKTIGFRLDEEDEIDGHRPGRARRDRLRPARPPGAARAAGHLRSAAPEPQDARHEPRR